DGADQRRVVRVDRHARARRAARRHGHHSRRRRTGNGRHDQRTRCRAAARSEGRLGVIRVLIADDHPVVRRGIAQTFDGIDGIVAAGEAATGADVLARLQRDTYDVLLLDLSMPDVDGLELLGRVKKRFPNLPVLVLTIYSEDQSAVRALRSGASGYLTKDSDPSELIG